MFAATLAILAANLSGLTSVYWACLVFGGGLLLISTVAGGDTDAEIGGDASFDADLDVDVDADVSGDLSTDAHGHHGGASSLSTWLSMQFAVFFLAMFGLVGVVMTHLAGTSAGVTAGAAVLGGLLVGQGAHQLLRSLRKSSGDSTPRPADYVNKPARVTIAMSHTDKGEVVLRIGRADRHVPSVARRADATFAIGDEVAVVGYTGGVAEVISKEEYEFLTQSA